MVASDDIAGKITNRLYGGLTLNPHTAIKIDLPWKIPNILMETVRAPRLFPKVFHKGAQPRDNPNEELTVAIDEANTPDEMNLALSKWYEEAELCIGHVLHRRGTEQLLWKRRTDMHGDCSSLEGLQRYSRAYADVKCGKEHRCQTAGVLCAT